MPRDQIQEKEVSSTHVVECETVGAEQGAGDPYTTTIADDKEAQAGEGRDAPPRNFRLVALSEYTPTRDHMETDVQSVWRTRS